MEDTEPDPLSIPAFLKRDGDNKAEYMRMSESVPSEVESRPAKSTKPKSNANGAAPVKAAGKPAKLEATKAPAKAKTAPKPAVKAAKGTEKAKVAKPKADSKVEKDQYGFRKGSLKSEAVAMYARKGGATLEEVKERLGSVQLNALVSLETEGDGYEVIRKKEEREGQRAVTRYFLKVLK